MKQILVFVLFSAMLCWLMFSPLYRHVLVVRQAVLQNEVNYMLEIGANASHGYIDSQMLQQSKERLKERGFDPDEITYVIHTLSGVSATDPSQPVLRGDGIVLEMYYPYERLFVLDQLVGATAPAENERMGARGVRMSEYVPDPGG